MNRFSIAILLAVTCACPAPAGEVSDVTAAACFPPGESIPVAASRHGGQIGRSDDPSAIHTTIPLGTVDVLGNGPYDLFMVPNRLYPFQGFDDEGVPFYGKSLATGGEGIDDVLTVANDEVYGIKAVGRKVQVCRFNKQKLAFERCAESGVLDLPGVPGGGLAGYLDPAGRLHVYSTISDQVVYQPLGDSHSATYNAEPVFDYVKQVQFQGERIKLGIHSCSPAPVDLGRGVIDLLVGEEAGTIRYYPGESLSVSGPGE